MGKRPLGPNGTADIFKDAWVNAQTTVGNAVDPTAAVHGAAGAFMACVEHLGWTSPQPHTIQTDEIDCDGNLILLKLDQTCPKVVQKYAYRKLSELSAAASSLADLIGGPPDLEPLAEVV